MLKRDQLYFLYKDVLARHGAIPVSEYEYYELMHELLNIYDKKGSIYDDVCC